MDGLFKLIFYIIIGIVWVISNTKKQTLWKDEQKPDFPAQKPKTSPLPKPKMDTPAEQGIFSNPAPAAPFDQFKKSYYDQKLDMKKERLQAKKQFNMPKTTKPKLQTNVAKKQNNRPYTPPNICNNKQKQSYHLKSSLKEGIIWSIVLGAPRSKQAFNWLTGPLNR